MDQRERILQLVREGVLSVEEGLDMLESLAKKEAKQSEQRDFTSDKTAKETVETAGPEDLFGPDFMEEQPEVDEEMERQAEEAKQQFEDELERIANELNKYSVDIDTINEELTELRMELSDVEDRLHDKKEALTSDYSDRVTELEDKVVNLNKEIELISAIDEIDNEQELRELNEELTKAMEELKVLKDSKPSVETDEEIKELEAEANKLRTRVDELTNQKNDLMKEMHALKMKQWTTKAKQVSENMEIPEGWRKGASKTIDRAGEIIDETSRTLGDVLRQTVKKTRETIENIDWQDINIDLGLKEKVTFEHEWLFEDTTATILDFKNANGDIQFKPSINDNIKIMGKIKLYGKMDEPTPLDAFEARSVINITPDELTFHIPNKNIRADLIVYLPQRDYDYIRSNSFNGDVTFNEIKTRDIYVKATNGNITFNKLTATMLEIKGTNGNITLLDTQLRDLLISTINGDVRVVGEVQSTDINTTNGVIRLTLSGDEVIRVAGGSVNGDVKISLPKRVGLEIEAKSTFGTVKSRLSDAESSLSPQGKGKAHKFYRLGETGNICRVNVQTTTGNILFKDTDVK